MRTEWIKVRSDLIDRADIRLLDAADRWNYVALLCCKAQGVLDDPGDLMMRKIAVKLELDLHELEEALARLVWAGLVQEDTYQPIDPIEQTSGEGAQ